MSEIGIMEQNSQEIEMLEMVEKTPIQRGVAPANYRWLWLYCVAFACLIGVSLALRKHEASPQIKIDEISKLQSAVYRVLLAEEIAVDEELEKSTSYLEQVLSNISSAKYPEINADFEKIAAKAALVLKNLNESDRKTAIGHVIEFSSLLDATQSKIYRDQMVQEQKDAGTFNHINWLALVSITVLAGCLVFSALRHRQIIMNESDAQLEKHIVSDQNHQLMNEYEEERQRTIELHQRLMDMGQKLKKLENSHEEKTKCIVSLESSLKAARAAMLTIDSKSRSVEAELEQKLAEIDVQSQSFYAVKEQLNQLNMELSEAVKSREEEIFLLNGKIASYEENLQKLDHAKSEVQNKLDHISSKLASALQANEIDIEQRISASLKEQKLSFESDLSILEWRNSKLASECELLGKDLVQAKDDALAQARQFRSMIADAEAEGERNKKIALRDLGERYESELRRLREDLRNATQEIDHLKSSYRAS